MFESLKNKLKSWIGKEETKTKEEKAPKAKKSAKKVKEKSPKISKKTKKSAKKSTIEEIDKLDRIMPAEQVQIQQAEEKTEITLKEEVQPVQEAITEKTEEKKGFFSKLFGKKEKPKIEQESIPEEKTEEIEIKEEQPKEIDRKSTRLNSSH